MKKCRVFAIMILACAIVGLLSACSDVTGDTAESWGSFTADKTYSYDEKYYATQSVDETQEPQMMKVTVCLADDDKAVAEFEPARARDFWGICWEKDTYNIWVQSGDIGTLCYAYHDGVWTLDGSVERPAYIISKYDQ